MSFATAVGGGVALGVIALVAAAVYRDAARVGVDLGSPLLWAGFIVLTSGAALITALLVPDAPIPGVLVLAALGPLLYVLERDDSMHGDDPADPTLLPSEASGPEATGDGESAPESDAATDSNRTDDREE